MLLRSCKTLSWVIVVWFALLQTMAPFIHGHMDTDHPDVTPAMHLHADDHDHGMDAADGAFVVDASHVTHTVSVAAGIANERTKARSIGLDLASTLLLIVCLLSLPVAARKRFILLDGPSDYSSRYRLPVAHAPPALSI